LNRFSAGEEIETNAEASALEWIWRQLETERLVRSGGRVGLGTQKIERRQRLGRVLTRAVELVRTRAIAVPAEVRSELIGRRGAAKAEEPVFRSRSGKLFGQQSRSNHKQFLVRRIAWRLQANAEGDC
jgi:hypothetical protein